MWNVKGRFTRLAFVLRHVLKQNKQYIVKQVIGLSGKNTETVAVYLYIISKEKFKNVFEQQLQLIKFKMVSLTQRYAVSSNVLIRIVSSERTYNHEGKIYRNSLATIFYLINSVLHIQLTIVQLVINTTYCKSI